MPPFFWINNWNSNDDDDDDFISEYQHRWYQKKRLRRKFLVLRTLSWTSLIFTAIFFLIFLFSLGYTDKFNWWFLTGSFTSFILFCIIYNISEKYEYIFGDKTTICQMRKRFSGEDWEPKNIPDDYKLIEDD
jgi:hypothetical protein